MKIRAVGGQNFHAWADTRGTW